MTIVPKVADFYHDDPTPDWKALADAGIIGIIHKCTQGTDFKDPTYASRREAAELRGFKWAAYHFLTLGDPIVQMDFFLKEAGAHVRYVLDWEPDPRGNVPSLAHALHFLQSVRQRTGQTPWLYAGGLLRGRSLPPAFGEFPLWLAEYASRAVVPLPWKQYLLWQYTETGKLTGDCSTCEVTDAELIAAWDDGV